MKICKVCRARFRGDPTRCPLDGGELEELPDPLLGRTMGGRYVVTQKIGAGGMGTVYRARHEAVGRDVAIKFLAPELALDATNRKRFLREAKAANRINHEHIIDITDFGETEDGLVFLVMEYLVGRPLNAVIEQGPMPTLRALGIILQMAQALARAHEFDVVHRDIKPDNIYLLSGHDGDFIKILDFGLAQMKGELRLTATGTVFGTPEYMSPEQARGAPATFAVDLYAVGCVFYELLTGSLPFTGTTPDLIIAHLRTVPEPPSSKLASIPRDVDRMIMRLLEKKPEDRYLDAYALADELKGILTDLSGISRMPRSEVGQISILPGQMAIAPTNPPPAMPPTSQMRQVSPGSSGAPGSQVSQTSDKSRPARDTERTGRPLLDAEEPTQTTVVEEAWGDRVEFFGQMADEAHPAGDGPAWLDPSISSMRTHITQIRDLRKRLDGLSQSAAQHEHDMRDARLRIGLALDELGRDESRILRQIAETQPRLDEATQRRDDLEMPLLRAWGAVSPLPAKSPRATREDAEVLCEAGHLASIWLEADRALGVLERDMSVRRREREDLDFQVAQLKGRLGTVNAESDLDLGSLRDQSNRLDSEIRKRVDGLLADAEPVVRHLNSFPFIRQRMSQSR